MGNTFIVGLKDHLYAVFRPTIDFLTLRTIPWSIRWRLLLFQPISLLTDFIGHAPWFLRTKPWRVEYVPTSEGRHVRILIFDRTTKILPEGKLRPLHVDIHGGAFIGGSAENDALFCALVAQETGAVVISTEYRCAPRYPFPAAIDDVDAVIAYLQKHAASKYGADAGLLTTSGFSAGGNLAFAACFGLSRGLERLRIKGTVTYYAAIDLRLSPGDKPRGKGVLESDPSAFLFPLFDCYAVSVRKENTNNPRMAPIVADTEILPDRMLLIVPGIDILVHEQLSFVERVKGEIEADERFKGKKSIEAKVYDKAFHGWCDLPEMLVGPTKAEAFQDGIRFLGKVYSEHGWSC